MARFERELDFRFTFPVGHQLLEQRFSEPVTGEMRGKEKSRCYLSNIKQSVVETSNVRYNEFTMIDPMPIDITNIPELVRIAEEVEATKQPYELRWKNKPVAVITPVTPGDTAKRPQTPTKADFEAFRSAAESWKDIVDGEQFKKDISESRKISTRPAVKL